MSDDLGACRLIEFCGRQATERVWHPVRRESMNVCDWHYRNIRRAFGGRAAHLPELGQ